MRPQDARRAASSTVRDVGCEAPAAEGKRRPRLAVLTVHGIGEQVQFETLEQVATGLCAADGQSPPEVIVTNVAFDRRHTAQRLDVVLHDGDGREIDVHLYEAYWAPLTEGVVKLHDVFRFLVRGSWRSLFAARRPFFRWIFEQMVDFGKQRRAFWGLLAATLLLLNLALLNAAIPAMAGWLFLSTKLPFGLPELFLNAVTFCFDLLLAALGLALGLLYVAWLMKRDHPEARAARRPVEVLGLIALVLGGLSLILLPEELVLLWFLHPLPRALLDSDWFALLTTRTAIAITWAALLVITFRIRYFFVEYVGDVTAYINPQALDRFTELRRKVRDSVCETTRLILGYKAPGDREWHYDAIAVVGHSLGSVIAYDVVNQLLMDDALEVARLDSLARVRTLLTFGSPLDKTAFVFGLHGKDTRDLREKLAARVQPLIEDYGNRTNLAWINVYSPFDVISGRLTFYDLEEQPLFPIRNERDPDATIPLAAHLEYWADRLIWKRLHEELVRNASQPPEDPARTRSSGARLG
jgi:hypothetical protein